MKSFGYLLFCFIATFFFFVVNTAYTANFVVDNLGDSDNGASYIGGDGNNTLRKCIRLANNNPGADNISFSISGTIKPSSPLPELYNDGTIIDASSRWIGNQPGIILDGANAGTSADGLMIAGADDCQIRGLFITKFNGNGINIGPDSRYNIIGGTSYGHSNVISGNNEYGIILIGIPLSNNMGANNNKIIGNFIGTDASGNFDNPNLSGGITLAFGAYDNIIGGSSQTERNIISGNGGDGIFIWGNKTDNNEISNNYIGTNIAGSNDISNIFNGIRISSGAQSNIGTGNLISGNGGYGVLITGLGTDKNKVAGNLIGTNFNGTIDIANFQGGVWIDNGAASNIIGGATITQRNIISGNKNHGVSIWDSGSNSNLILGNYIGTNASGTGDLGNDGYGVWISNNAQSNIIGGSSASERNIISGNKKHGVVIDSSGTRNNKVSGNYIGLNFNGSQGIPNNWNGVEIFKGARSNIIGGLNLGERNIISGNGKAGLSIFGAGTDSNKVSGNYIGTDANGNADLGNWEDGVIIHDGAQQNIIGGASQNERNVISGNDLVGVNILGSGTNENKVSGNYIGTNANGNAILGNTREGVLISNGAKLNIIGGTSAAERNVISGNNRRGVNISGLGTMNNIVLGNYIGIDATGYNPLGNRRCGVGIERGASSNTIGGLTALTRNVISKNGSNGVRIVDSGSNSNTVLGNYIGTDSAGNNNLGNEEQGIYIHNGAQSNFISNNQIAFSGLDGVRVENTSSDYNKITQNSIYDNSNKGISLLEGGNDEIATPIISSGKLDNNILALDGIGAGSFAVLEFYVADSLVSGEGKKYLGSLVANSSGNFTGTIDVSGKNLSANDYLVATTTHSNNNTSEFSIPVKIRSGGVCFTLKEGWNLISFSVNRCYYYGSEPAGQPGCVQTINVQSLGFNSLASWFDSVIFPSDSWLMVIGAYGAMDRNLPPEFHSLKYMSAISGYWVKIAQGKGGAEICLDGDAFNPNCAIPLTTGWNLAGYPINTGYYDTPNQPNIPGVNWVKVNPPVAAYVFKSINGKYSMIIGKNGAYNPELPPEFSSLRYIIPSQAFWIKMTTPGDLKYSLVGYP